MADFNVSAVLRARDESFGSTADAAKKKIDGLTQASNENAKASARQAFAMRNAGQQVGDFAMQVSTGTRISQAFSQQIGQLGYAMSDMGGRAGAVGRFLTGPWGIALTTAAVVLSPFVDKLFESNNELDDLQKNLASAVKEADSFGRAQAILGSAIDLTTGKFKTQNEVLRETIRLQAEAALLAGQKDEKDARNAIRRLADPSFGQIGRAALAGIAGGAGTEGAMAGSLSRLAAENNGLRAIRDEILGGGLNDATEIRKRVDVLAQSGQLAQYSAEQIIELKEQLFSLPRAVNDQKAARAALDAIDGKGIAPELVPYSRGTKKTKRTKSTSGLENFGRDSADRIAEIQQRFTALPSQVLKVNSAMRDLDAIIADLEAKKPPNYQTLVDQAREAKKVVQEGINEPFNDFVRKQEQSLEVGALLVRGRRDEAEALQAIITLQERQGPLSEAQKANVIETVRALREQQRELEVLQQRQQHYLNALGDIRAAVRGVVFDGLDGIANLPKRLLDAFMTLKGEQLFERVFGQTFRELEDEIRGTNTASKSAEAFATKVNSSVNALSRFNNALDRASGGSLSTDVTDLIANNPDLFPGSGDIVVTGNRPMTPEGLFSKTFGKLAEKVLGPDSAKQFGQLAGKALGGAATGSMVQGVVKPLGDMLGIKTSSTGAQIGGSIGAMTGIPGGDIIGSIIGSVVGGLFKTTRSAGATLTGPGDYSVGGKDRGNYGIAGDLAGTVLGGLDQIAAAFGGTLGSFNTTIGVRGGKYRVNRNGTSLKTSQGATDYGEDAEAAVAAAIADAIADGAIQGLSAAVQKALQSSEDVNAAVTEALKVREVEDLISGITTEAANAFRAFENQAKERLRIAKEYGFDLVQLEKINAEERAKLFEQTLSSRVGSLQTLLDDLNFGDLSTGSLAEQRKKIQDQLSQATKDALAGKAGAADRVAELNRQLLGVTMEGYGTAGGEYAADRGSAQSNAQAIIQAESDRLRAQQVEAQKAQQAATKTAELADENNAQNAEMISLLRQIASAQGVKLTAASGLANTARSAAL